LTGLCKIYYICKIEQKNCGMGIYFRRVRCALIPHYKKGLNNSFLSSFAPFTPPLCISSQQKEFLGVQRGAAAWTQSAGWCHLTPRRRQVAPAAARRRGRSVFCKQMRSRDFGKCVHIRIDKTANPAHI